MGFFYPFFVSGLLGNMVCGMLPLWVVSVIITNVSIVDAYWGASFGVMSLFYMYNSPGGLTSRKLLLLALTFTWATRLSVYLFTRNHGAPEDYRYQKFRRHYDSKGWNYWWFSFIQVFTLQGVIGWVISLPLAITIYYDGPAGLTTMDHIGALVWGFGFFWEAVGDWQLAEFKKTKKAGPDAVLNTGLWKYTRHPNYFGESVMWWGLWLISTNVGLFTSILVAPAPALMTFLLMNVSGVPLLEKKLNERPKYKEYVETTSQFVPWFPKARATTSSSKSK